MPELLALKAPCWDQAARLSNTGPLEGWQEDCKVWGLVHFSASKTLPLAKSVGRKHGPDPFLATERGGATVVS